MKNSLIAISALLLLGTTACVGEAPEDPDGSMPDEETGITDYFSTPSPLAGYVPSVGPARDILLDNGLAYIASDAFGLAVVDVHNPAAPIAIGGADQPFYGDHVAKAGTRVVVGSARAGLRLYDVATPSRPHTLGGLAGSIREVAMAADGSTAYLRVMISGNPGHIDLVIVDLRTGNPTVVSQTVFPGGAGLAVVGTTLFVGAGTDGLKIYDITQPRSPALHGSLPIEGGANMIVAANGFAYVTGNVVSIVDARSPTAPRLVGSYAFAAQTLALSSSRLYAINTVQMAILDVTNPAAPALLGTSTSYGAQGGAATGTLVYLTSPTVDRTRDTGGLTILDTTNAAAPARRGHLLGGLENEGLAVAGTIAVATGRSSAGGLQVLGIQDPVVPKVLGRLAGAFKGVALDSTASVAYARITVAGNPGHCDLAVVDVTNRAAPTIISQTVLPGGSSVTVEGSLLYVGAGSEGLQIYDITLPRAPHLVGRVTPTNGASIVAVANGLAYVANGSAITVIDARTPTSPRVIGSIAAIALSLAASSNRLYAVNSSQLLIFDVSNPATPTLLSTSPGYGAQGVALDGTQALLAAPADPLHPENHGIYFIDVTYPAQPKLIEKSILAGNARSVVVSGNHAYVGESAGIVSVVAL